MSKTVKELKNYENLHAARMAGVTVRIAGVEFDLRPLTTSVYTYVETVITNPVERLLEYVRFGVSDVRGEDAEWETVNIAGRDYKALTRAYVDDLLPGPMSELGQMVSSLSAFGTAEARALDFTSPTPRP